MSGAEQRAAATAWLLAPVVEAALGIAGLDRTLRWIEAATEPRARPRGNPAPPAQISVGRLAWIVDGVYRWHLVRGQCLPRALVQYAIHRQAGTAVRFVVGVRRPAATAGAASRGGGIEAHAWVEAVDGALNSTATQDGFVRLE
jgi:hypothetical protein